MASITPILYFNNTETSTSATSETDISRKTSALANGVDYLVLYYGNCGGSDTSAEPRLALRFGPTGTLTSGTELAQVNGEGRGTSDHWDSVQCQGICEVTGDGTNVLGFTAWDSLGSNTTYVGAVAIIAIPKTDFPSGSYYFGGTNSGADELTNASTSAMEDVRSETFNLDEDADYLILMSYEVASQGFTTSHGYVAEFTVDGTQMNPIDYREEWEDSSDVMGIMCADVQTLTSGNHTFACRLQSESSANCDGRRSRIAVIKMDAFDQYENRTTSTEQNSTATSYGTDSMLSGSYTPNQQEYVVIIGCWNFFCNTTDTANWQLNNTTDTVLFCVDAGEYNNNGSSPSAGDYLPGSVLGCEQISGATTYRVDLRVQAGTGTWGDGDTESRLIFWSLTTADAAVTLTPGATAIPLVVPSIALALSLTLSPGATAVPISAPDPSVALQLGLSPDATPVPLSVPSVSLDIPIGLAPDPAPVALSVPDPAVARALGITPGATAIPILVPDPTLAKLLGIAPDPGIVTLAFPDPSVDRQLAVSPDATSVVLAVPDPSVALALGISPDAAAVAILVPAPAAALALSLNPGATAIPVSIPDPSVDSGTLNLVPDPATVDLQIPDPAVQLTADLSPDATAVLIVIPNPSVDAGSGAARTPIDKRWVVH